MKNVFKSLFLILLFALIVLFCVFSAEVTLSVKNAITVCSDLLIPSLLPCIFISNLIIKSNLIYLFPKNIQTFFLLLLSMISGYPVGANILNECVINNQISKDTAAKLLPSFINSGPAFVISMIGSVLLQNKRLGILLFASGCLASLFLYSFLGGFKIKLNSVSVTTRISENIFKSAVSAINSLKIICIFVLLFFAFKEIINKVLGSVAATVFTFLGEITSSVIEQRNVYVISFLLSWCGLCVYLQVFSIVKFKVSYINVIGFRLIHAIISIIITKILITVFKINVVVFSNINYPVSFSIPNNFTYLVITVFSLICLLFSIRRKSSGKFSLDLL